MKYGTRIISAALWLAPLSVPQAAEPDYPPRQMFPPENRVRLLYPESRKAEVLKLKGMLPPATVSTIPACPETLVIFGGLDENPAMENLYARFVTDADAVTPGPGGALVQTIPNYPAPGGRVIIVAGNVPDAAERIRERLANNLPDIYDFTGPAAAAYRKTALRSAAASFKPEQTWKNFYALAEAHRLTGDAKYRDAMIKSLECLEPIVDNHYGMGLVIRGYDYWARGGLIPAELIRKADRIFLRYLIGEAGSWWRRSEDRAVFADNRHHVYGTWGYLQTAEMLWRGLDSAQRKSAAGRFIRERIEECDRWFAACRREYRPTVLSTGVFINLNIFLLHALQNNREEISGDWLVELAKLSAAAADNTGGAIGLSGYEDTYPGFWTKNYPVGGVLNPVTYLTGSPAIKYLREVLPGTDNNTWWNLSSDTRSWADGKPAASSGVFTGFQKVFGNDFPLYVSYRNGFSPDDLFFCLTGSGTADIDAGDSGKGDQTYPGMLARLSWNSLPFFVQNTNSTTPLNRNTLTVDRTGKAEKIRTDLRCEEPGKIDGLDYLTMFADGYCGADWRRRIMVRNNDFMLVSDTVTAAESDRYSGILTWRTPYAARRTAAGAEISFNGRRLQMACAADAPLESRVFRSDAAQGALRPDLIRQYFSARLEKGGSMTLGTLLYPGEERYQLRMPADDVFLLRRNDTGTLALAGFGKFSTPVLNLEAPVFCLTEDAEGYPAGVLPRELQRLWNAAAPVRVPPRPAIPAAGAWRYTGFSPGRLELRDFVIHAPDIPDIDRLCSGNLDRTTRHSGKSPLELTVEFPAETYMSESVMLFAHDNGRGKWYLNPPSDSPKVEAAIDGRPRAFLNRPCLELDESYKGTPYSYTGTAVPVAATGKKFTFRIDAGQLYQVRFFGAERPAEAVDALALDKDKLLLRSDRNEIVCLRVGDGTEIWRRQFPCGIRSWAAGTGLVGLACADSTVKAIDPRDGRMVWSCDTSAIPLGLPYSVAAYGDGFIASSYYHLTVIGPDGRIRNPDQRILPGMWIYNVMGNIDLNGDGFPDAVGRALWGHVSLFDGKTSKVDYFANINGSLTDWRLLKGADGSPELLVVSYDGIGLYHAAIRPELLHGGWDHAPDEDALLLEPRSQREIWAHRFQCGINAFTKFNGEFLLGFESGVIRAYRRDGGAAWSLHTGGAPVTGLAVWQGHLLVNTGTHIGVYDADRRCLGNYELKNNGIRAFPENGVLLALVPGGAVAVRLPLPPSP